MLSDLSKQRKAVLIKVKDNILSAQKKQKDVYDQKHSSVAAFQVSNLCVDSHEHGVN